MNHEVDMHLPSLIHQGIALPQGNYWRHLAFTLRGVRSAVMFCIAFFTCSTGHWADTAAIVQHSW